MKFKNLESDDILISPFEVHKTFNVTNNDTMFVNTYYNDGTLKVKGIKVNKLKQGEWYYYNTNGFPFKIEKYKNDKVVSSMDLTALRGAK